MWCGRVAEEFICPVHNSARTWSRSHHDPLTPALFFTCPISHQYDFVYVCLLRLPWRPKDPERAKWHPMPTHPHPAHTEWLSLPLAPHGKHIIGSLLLTHLKHASSRQKQQLIQRRKMFFGLFWHVIRTYYTIIVIKMLLKQWLNVTMISTKCHVSTNLNIFWPIKLPTYWALLSSWSISELV